MNGWNELKQNVIDKGNCCLCGTCVGICPVQTPIIQNGQITESGNICINCRQCIAACPGNGYHFPSAVNKIFHENYNTANRDFGFYQSILKGYASDFSVRNCSSSGGVITAIGCYLLEQGFVDYVIGVIENKPGDFRAQALNSVDDVKRAAQSKYIFVPTNETIRFIREHEGRYLFIGLPCQIEAMRKVADHDSLVANRIFLFIGLFCGFNLTKDATDYLVRKSGFEKDEITSLGYRVKKGDKTGFQIISGEKSFFITKHGYTLLNMIFSRPRCWKCFDYSSEFADLSFGDAWEEECGWSRIVCRSQIGKEILNQMAVDGVLVISPSSEEDIYKTQKKVLFYKKRDIATRKLILQNFPDYGVRLQRQSPVSTMRAILFTFCLRFGQTNFCRKIFDLIPIRLLEKISEGLRSGSYLEIIRYLFWGVMTTAVNLLCFWGFQAFGLNYKTANLFTIILTKLAAYAFNKFFVFKTATPSVKDFITELSRFIAARVASAFIDYFGLILLVDNFHIGSYPGKIIILVVVTIVNYFFGKYFVYNQKT